MLLGDEVVYLFCAINLEGPAEFKSIFKVSNKCFFVGNGSTVEEKKLLLSEIRIRPIN